MTILDISESQEIFTVSGLNREVRFLLEGSFPLLWVEGEISNFAAPNSGHWYFSLKDASAQVRCAMFKPQQRKINFTPKDGTQVIAKARVSLYEGRGEYQLIVEHIEDVGEGKLRLAFDALKKKLHEEGLFQDAYKKPLPAYPKCIGVITSATGAAIRDILSVLKRRYPCVPIIIYPTLVQGNTAAGFIVEALRKANVRKECDVLLLARGGGSLEDLWPFNEETVARAIFQSEIPIISGVGHEVDFTIADFVADLRAPTPSAAAELATPDSQELLQALAQKSLSLQNTMQNKLALWQKQLAWMNKHLQQQHPKRRLREQTQRLDFYEMTLQRLQKDKLSQLKSRIETLKAQLQSVTPKHRLKNLNQTLQQQWQNLNNYYQKQLSLKQSQLGQAAAKLNGLSPLATLERGYAIVTQNQHIIKNATEIKTSQPLQIRINRAELSCTVNTIQEIKTT